MLLELPWFSHRPIWHCAMVEFNAAQFYGFDLPSPREVGARIGPTVEEVNRPIELSEYPADSTCNAFEREVTARAW